MKHLSIFLLALGMILISGYARSQTYCKPPNYLSGPYTGITKVIAGSISNATAYNDGYTDYSSTAGTCNVNPGGIFSFTITCYYDPSMLSFFSGKLNLRVWIDWDQNFSFSDPGEAALSDTINCSGSTTSNPYNTSTYTIQVPKNAKPGITRMRVYEDMMPVDGHEVPNPCGYNTGVGQHGECEDYKINVSTTSSVNEISVRSGPLVTYPNPAKNQVIIGFPLQANHEKIIIQDLNGKTCKQYDVTAYSKKIEIDVADLPKGLYFIRMNEFSSKLIVE
jgi:hypothetical protein